MALFPALLVIIHMASSSCRTISFESLEGKLESSKKLADLFLPLLEQSSEPKRIKRIELSEYNDGDRKKKRLKKFEQYGKKHLVEIAPLKPKTKDKKTPLAIIVTAPGMKKNNNWKNIKKYKQEDTFSNFSLEDFFRGKDTDFVSNESEEVNEASGEENDEMPDVKNYKSSVKDSTYSTNEENSFTAEEKEHKKENRDKEQLIKESEEHKKKIKFETETVDTLEKSTKKESAENKSNESESESVSIEHLKKKMNIKYATIENKEKFGKERTRNELKEMNKQKNKISENLSEESDESASEEESINKSEIETTNKRNSDSSSNDGDDIRDKGESKPENSEEEKLTKESYITLPFHSNEVTGKNSKKEIHHDTETSKEYIINENDDDTVENTNTDNMVEIKADNEDKSNNKYISAEGISDLIIEDVSKDELKGDDTSETKVPGKIFKSEDVSIEYNSNSKEQLIFTKEGTTESVDEDSSIIEKENINYKYKKETENSSEENSKQKGFEIANIDNINDESNLASKSGEEKESLSENESEDDNTSLESKDGSLSELVPLADSSFETSEHIKDKRVYRNKIEEFSIEDSVNKDSGHSGNAYNSHQNDSSNQISNTELEIGDDTSDTIDDKDCENMHNEPDITIKELKQIHTAKRIIPNKKGYRRQYEDKFDSKDKPESITVKKKKSCDYNKKSISYNTNKSYKLSFLFNK